MSSSEPRLETNGARVATTETRAATTETRSATYGVRGLTCGRCLVSAIDEVRALPGVDAVRVDLVPYGESLLTVAPDGAVSVEQVRTTLRHVGFEVVNRRRTPVPLGSGQRRRPRRRSLRVVLP